MKITDLEIDYDIWLYQCKEKHWSEKIYEYGIYPSNASVISHSRAQFGLFPGCFEQKSYVHLRILPPVRGP